MKTTLSNFPRPKSEAYPTQRVNSARDRLMVALDYPTAASALELVVRLEDRVAWFKVGLELYLAAGPSIVETLRARGFNVFVDLKLHDIPNTVAGAVRSLGSVGASLLTVHASGGRAMLLAAAEAAERVPHGPRLLAVTVLTSMDAQMLDETGVPDTPLSQAVRLARLAHSAGISGMVCSPRECPDLRACLGPHSLLVVPGIRPAGSPSDDQSRISTPALALHDGASHLVVGRPITRAADPSVATEAILHEMNAALTSLQP